MSQWDPGQYERFAAERAAPFFDLLALIEPCDMPRVVDLGCGTGELTVQAHLQLDARQTIGIDNSSTMLARAHEIDVDGVTFRHGDITSFSDEGAFDVLLSNAALQWLPDHAAMLARWTRALGPEGQLAVQLPSNADHPSHAVADALAHESPFIEAFDGDPPPDPTARVLAPEAYAEILEALGFSRQHVRLQVYPHHLDSSADVVEWVKGTSLTRVKARLSPVLYVEFLERYRERLIAAIGDCRPYLYTFKRILFWARRT
ncbi:MAG: methyltransferase domain-containing protein [Acidimicrobiales bacterium]